MHTIDSVPSCRWMISSRLVSLLSDLSVSLIPAADLAFNSLATLLRGQIFVFWLVNDKIILVARDFW